MEINVDNKNCQLCGRTLLSNDSICSSCHWRQVNLNALNKNDRKAIFEKIKEIKKRLHLHRVYEDDAINYAPIVLADVNFGVGIGQGLI